MYNNLYIQTAKITKENILRITEMNLLPIFLNHDLRVNPAVSNFHSTAVHYPKLAPSRYLFFKGMAGMTSDEFKKEYYIELESKNFSEILRRLDFLKELSGADGIVLMDGLEIPSFLEWLSEYINSKEFLDEDVKPLKL
jgi:hypothetical protein